MKRLAFLVFLVACGPVAHNQMSGDDQPDGGIPPGCGDGVVQAGEECDDGNHVDQDGCSAACKLESTGIPCTPHSYRCGPGGDVEMCNNAGTAWLTVEACATGCAAGVCNDPTCTAGATRCHGNQVETCNASGSGWDPTETCTTYCELGQCALPGQTVTQNTSYQGTVIVAGDLVVTGNSTLTASDGDLTIIADNIRVEAGAAIAAAPMGEDTRGASCRDSYYGYFYAANYGQTGAATRMWSVYGGDDDAAVDFGAIGGKGSYTGCQAQYASATAVPTHGGGRLHLIAKHDVTIAGQLVATGENAKQGDPAGGSGGGIQIAGDTIEITGSISTAGGTGGSAPSGWGRVRLLYGTTLMNTGTIIGAVTQGRRPPIQLTSSTHPDPTLVYNDDFTMLSIAHERSFDTAQGYLHAVDRTEHNPPMPSTGVFSAIESFDVASTTFVQGNNWVHVAAIDASSALGTVESRFPVTINTMAPAASSTSHPSATTWYPNANPYFAWTMPQNLDDKNFRGVRYVLDHYGDTLPTTADTALPVGQKQLLVSNLVNGIWALHVVSEDTMGRLTKKAAHVIVRVGPDPGAGTVFGTVFDENHQPVSGAVVRINRGLFQATTNAQGSYTVSGVAAGVWEVSVVYTQHTAPAQMLQVDANAQASANFTLAHI